MQIDLSVQKVTKKFQEFIAVNSVSFEVQKGRFFSILGPSGCGKTTLLRMIAGLTEPNEGTIEIRGKSMAGVSPNKRPVNLIFQHLALFPMMNVGENIAFGLKRRGENKANIKKRSRPFWNGQACPGLIPRKLISFRAVKNSGWPLPDAWYWSLQCCCWTNHWEPWTLSCGSR